jgi:hypothetical protein
MWLWVVVAIWMEVCPVKLWFKVGMEVGLGSEPGWKITAKEFNTPTPPAVL